ncbi:cation-transporting P-type ATPase [Thiomicrorhabdus cannonii]|uniref:cation-transporting P-type ATPase n=1 Tax=Thiomicrorhabdus cannonii TaxID=2748011 RepID=UPI0015B99D6B|nr:cation-transporting P-type ATPase [Thiomicrorhabdus cannonii]
MNHTDMTTQPWHQLDHHDVLTQLASSESGLSSTEAETRLQTYGPNRLPAPPKPSLFKRFLLQFHNILIYVLLGSASITLLLGHLADTAVILAVVLINAVIGVIQEGKAEQAMEAIRDLLAPQAAVIRDGKRLSLPGEQLVPGDIVLLEAGDKVPADLRLLASHGLQIQEAILTGESVAAEKQTQTVNADAALGDRTCMAFSGTTVTNGQGKGVVVATAAGTEIGRISGMLSEVSTLTTPLIEQTDHFAKWLTWVILGAALFIFGYGILVYQQDVTELFLAVVGLSVAAIPEGLPAVLTITLAVGVKAMAKRQAIVRRLPAIETIGAVSVICTDKTGTLTRNEMSVDHFLNTDGAFEVESNGYAPVGAITQNGTNTTTTSQQQALLMEVGNAVVLCNDAELSNLNETWQVHGDPMEGALLAFAEKCGVSIQDSRHHWSRTDLIPFDAAHKFMATLHHDHENHALIVVKGAPEKILQLCEFQRQSDGGSAPIERDFWHNKAEWMAAQGQRLLAIAVKTVPPEHTVMERADLDNGLVMLGLVGLIDPPRPESIAAVAECRQAGIRIKMITGDHALTASAIAKQIGLQHPQAMLTGVEIDQLDDDALRAKVLETDVFARTSPEHKLRLVEALQAHGLIVAMTGDGVNDAPALKRADAGIAMGKKGSEAAKEASELVLADDNFATIAAAVREGRTAYANIKKVISWTLPTSTGEAAVITLAILVGLTLPVTAIQILWINLVTAITLGIALAFEPTDNQTMKHPPRARNQPLLDRSLVWHIVLVSGLFIVGVFGLYSYAIAEGRALEEARTIAVNTLVVMEIFHLLFIRNMDKPSLTLQDVRGTPAVWTAIGLVLSAQLLITYFPAMQSLFQTRALGWSELGWVLTSGIMLFVLLELEKRLRLTWLARRTRA